MNKIRRFWCWREPASKLIFKQTDGLWCDIQGRQKREEKQMC